jgi:hypothetical protein
MTVTDLLLELSARFPKAPIKAWAGDYARLLSHCEGERLKTMWRDTMDKWVEPTPPRPAHFQQNIPQGEKPKSHSEVISQRDYERLKRQRVRAESLQATANRECAAFMGHEWSGLAQFHLLQASHEIARLEEGGLSLDAALLRINARPRPGYKLRAPDLWLDESDAEIFRKRFESQKRVNPKGRFLRRGDDEPKWSLRSAPVDTGPSAVAERLAKIRDATQQKLTEMHKEVQG